MFSSWSWRRGRRGVLKYFKRTHTVEFHFLEPLVSKREALRPAQADLTSVQSLCKKLTVCRFQSVRTAKPAIRGHSCLPLRHPQPPSLSQWAALHSEMSVPTHRATPHRTQKCLMLCAICAFHILSFSESSSDTSTGELFWLDLVERWGTIHIPKNKT